MSVVSAHMARLRPSPLTHSQRRVLALRESMTAREVARVLGWPVRLVREVERSVEEDRWLRLRSPSLLQNRTWTWRRVAA